MIKNPSIIFTCLVILLISGCGTKRVATVDSVRVIQQELKQEEELKAPKSQIPVNTETLREHSLFSSIKTLRSEVRAKVMRGGKKIGSFNGALAFRAPDALRLQLYSPMGSTLADIVRVVGMMNIYVPAQKTIYTGWAPQFSMPADAIYSVEVGGPKHILYVFEPHGAEVKLLAKYFYDPLTLTNTSIIAYHNDKRSMGMYFGQIINQAPEYMNFTFEGDFQIEMLIKNPEVNIELKSSLFHPFDKRGKDIRPLGELLSMDDVKSLR